jgi:hypothetical protein
LPKRPSDKPWGFSSEVIHPSAWKGNSANFALTEFSEVRIQNAA